MLQEQRIVLCSLLASLVLLAPVPSVSADQPRSYPMMCRGGGYMTFHVYNRRINIANMVTTRRQNTILKIWFEKGDRAITEGPLAPGQCTWTDRGMSDSEPSALIIQFGKDIDVEEIMRADGTLLRYEYVGPERKREVVKHVIDSILNGDNFQVQAYQQQTGDGNYFIASRVGP